MCGKQQAKVSDGLAVWAVCVTSGRRRLRMLKQVKSPVHLCSLNKTLSCVGFRTVLVFISWRSVEVCECWTCAWLLSLIIVVLILLMNALQNHSSTVHSRKQTHLNRWWTSFTVYNKTSWRQNLTDMFDILYEYWIFFSLWNMCIYTVVYVYDVMSGFSLVEILSEMGSHVSPPTCLGISDWTGISAVTVSLWRSHHDLSDSADSTIVYWLQLPCSVPVLFVSLSLSLSAAWCWHGLLNARKLTS